MLESYVQPQLTYGSNLWIFQAFPDIRFDLQPRRPYGGAFKELSRVYSRLLGACAAARKHTSFTAIHVRLGRLPLQYLLGFYAMCDLHSIIHERTTNTMKEHLEILRRDPTTWSTSIFYKPALSNLKYFSKFTEDGHLLNITSPGVFRKALRGAMYRELSISWKKHLLARSTFNILPRWEQQTFSRTSLKEAEGFYIRCCFSRNDTRFSRNRFHQDENTLSTVCPRCQKADETVNHILLECPKLQPYRSRLVNKIQKKNPHLPITLQTLLTKTEIQLDVIGYINAIIKHPTQ